MRINNICMCYVYGMRESTGKYTEVWQRLGSESVRVALAYCLHCEGTKVHNPRRYILLCIVILCCMYYIGTYSMRMRYVYGMRESTGKYTEVWQRLSSESLRVALAYCLR